MNQYFPIHLFGYGRKSVQSTIMALENTITELQAKTAELTEENRRLYYENKSLQAQVDVYRDIAWFKNPDACERAAKESNPG